LQGKEVKRMAIQKFDFAEANALKTKLSNEARKIEADLTKMTTQVEDIRKWWAGGSEEAFIQNFKDTKVKIVKSLNECIGNYQKLIDQVSKAKQDSDAEIARQLRT
jgi:uncharacterized protein YukE